MPEQSTAALRVVLAGAHGFGRLHLENLLRLRQLGRAELVGICDPTPVSPAQLAGFGEPTQSASLPGLVAATRPDVVIVATPIHTHADLAVEAAAGGAHILLEKPPAPSWSEFSRIKAAVEAAGVACQVGFQSFGSRAVAAAAAAVRDGTLGHVRAISAAGAWQRDTAYFGRSRWAGRRRLDGVDVVDGALTNPFAHALAAALRVDGSEAGDVQDVETELWHAYDIESDDTACLRLRTPRGTTMTVAVTLCAEVNTDPYLLVHGERGRAVLWYTSDRLRIDVPAPAGSTALLGDGGPPDTHEGRTDLLENLADHLAAGVPLLAPLSATSAFMQVVEAIRQAPAPRRIPQGFVRRETLNLGGVPVERRTVPGIDRLVTAAAEQAALFSELGTPWEPADPVPDGERGGAVPGGAPGGGQR